MTHILLVGPITSNPLNFGDLKNSGLSDSGLMTCQLIGQKVDPMPTCTNMTEVGVGHMGLHWIGKLQSMINWMICRMHLFT